MTSPSLNFSIDQTHATVSTRANSAGLTYISNGGLTLVSGLPVSDGLGFAGFGNDPFVNGPLQAANGGLVPQTLTTAVYQNIHLVVGQMLRITTRFIPGESHYRDEAVALLKDLNTGSIVAGKIADVQTVIDNKGATEYVTTFTVGATSTYNLLVGVADIGDKQHPSTLKVEEISIVVPAGQYSIEPNGIKLADSSLLSSDGSILIGNASVPSLLSNSAASLIAGLDAKLRAGVISNDGGSLISQDGGGVISNDGGSLISQDGGGVISNDGGSLISQDGGGLISQDGGGLLGGISSAQLAQIAANLQQANGLQSRAYAAASASGLTSHNYGIMSLDQPTETLQPGSSSIYVAPVAGLEVEATSGATVNRYDERSAVADLGGGKYVVAFSEYDVLGNGSRAYTIRAQIINADGSPAGAEIRVNSPSDSTNGTGSELDDPSVAAIGGGGFVVAWVNGQHPRSPGLTTGSDLFAQRFNADGSPHGPGVQLNATVSNTQYNTVKVTALAGGGYVAIWSEKPGNTSASVFTLHGKVFNADGTQRGTDFSLSGGAFFANIYSPTVTATTGGGFIAAFQGNVPNPQTGGVITGIGVQAYDANGAPTTRNPTLVQGSDVDSLTKPNLVTLSNGDVAVAWVDNTQHAVYSLVLTASLVAKETQPTYVGGSYSDFYGPPAMAALSDGRFVVGWTDSSQGFSAQAQILNGNNTLYGPQFPVYAPGGGDGTSTPALIQLSTGMLIASSTHKFSNLPADDVRALPIAVGGTSTPSTAPPGQALITGSAVHGYVSGGTVFADANGNGTLDAGEISATTTPDGFYALAPGAIGTLILTGGTDIATGRPFAGRYTAPAGSQTIDALTTLVQRVMDAGADIGTAQFKVATALGLSADAALTQVDPVVASQASASGRAILLANATVADVSDLAIAAGSADPLGAFAALIAAQAGFTSFDPGSMTALAAAGLNGQTLVDTSAIAKAVGALLMAKGTADAGDPAKLLGDVNRAEVVVQTGAAPALAAAISSGTSAAVAAAYTGASLDAQFNASTPNITPSTVGVFRFFDLLYGTHFFTASTSERDTILATRPDLVNEGVGLQAVDPASNDANAVAVFRFFDTKFGTHFFTASTSERDQVIAGRSDLAFEGTGFYEHTIKQAGDVPVYRFFDNHLGTHFYTADAGERANIVATRADLIDEGIGFYAPKAL